MKIIRSIINSKNVYFCRVKYVLENILICNNTVSKQHKRVFFKLLQNVKQLSKNYFTLIFGQKNVSSNNIFNIYHLILQIIIILFLIYYVEQVFF